MNRKSAARCGLVLGTLGAGVSTAVAAYACHCLIWVAVCEDVPNPAPPSCNAYIENASIRGTSESNTKGKDDTEDSASGTCKWKRGTLNSEGECVPNANAELEVYTRTGERPKGNACSEPCTAGSDE
jgi:hypothetical protein